MERKRLVLFAEGPGDAAALPILVRRVISQLDAWGCVTLDPHVFRVRSLADLTGKQVGKWIRHLRAAAKRKEFGGVLLVVDGDHEKMRLEGITARPFCAADAAKFLATKARDAGAGSLFSVAVVIARQEFETWLIAGVESLAGRPLPDGRMGVHEGVVCPDADLEESPRDAKRWLGERMASGYKETTDQEILTGLVDLEVILRRNLRSFRRFDNAVDQLVKSIREGRPIVSPE